MKVGRRVGTWATGHPWVVTVGMLALTGVLVGWALLPTLAPERFPGLNGLRVDTDPENMLPHDEPVRVFHDRMKEQMALYDMVVVGVVNETDPDGVFNPASLRRIYELTQYAETLQWPDPERPGKTEGVIPIDLIAPSTVESIEQGEAPGVVAFEWLMKEPPATREEARAMRDRAARIPFLNGTLVSEDGRAMALYLPLTAKDLSSRVYNALWSKIETFEGEEEYHITGLPVAEDVFGVEMFIQMAISAPLAMLVIFLLMLFFFRKVVLVLSPMIVALVCVLMTMALLVVTGNTVHIMSSMIPIFIMPIAVLDAVHILSEFYDRYPETRDRRKTILHVLDELFVPMLYTTVTTVVGFGSLALVPIPPVQVFGVFVAFGVVMAWFWTILFIPAFIMVLKPATLEGFGLRAESSKEAQTGLSALLERTGRVTYRAAKPLLAGVLLLSAGALYGITRIEINDNPTKWFTSSHPIRVADRVLNDHFGGTYMGYLALAPTNEDRPLAAYVEGLEGRLAKWAVDQGDSPAAHTVSASLVAVARDTAKEAEAPAAILEAMEIHADESLFAAAEAAVPLWDAALSFLAAEGARDQVFKQPAVLSFLDRLEEHLLETGIVGKVNSLSDIVKTVRRELVSGRDEDFALPATPNAVAQTLLQYQNSHRPQDLWHFVTPDYRQTVLWLQLRSGDNRDMERVVASVEEFMAGADMPAGIELKHEWFGLTYINVIWQNKMVWGMLKAFLGSFLTVFLMMTFLYRSALWGALSMIPLTVTIAVIYGVIGLIGKDYDMPVAVLSALSLGLAIDYAIHFLSRSRSLYRQHGSWKAASGPVFGEPARAITRNAVVIGIGFLPLLAAPLVPYKTVGIFIAAILLLAGLASLLLLPSLITLLEPFLFPRSQGRVWICNCGTCVLGSAALVAIVVVNAGSLLNLSPTALAVGSLLVIAVLSGGCLWMVRSRLCRVDPTPASGAPSNERPTLKGDNS